MGFTFMSDLTWIRSNLPILAGFSAAYDKNRGSNCEMQDSTIKNGKIQF